MRIINNRSCLKWAGGKKKLVPEIQRCLPKRGIKRLIEPFVGGASVFLNTRYANYLLVDTNADLIAFYQQLQSQPQHFITEAARYFDAQHNTQSRYYEHREQFNQSSDPLTKACLFLYLNRHGFNGLCRYNSSGGYNVPFGRYKRPYFPETEMQIMAQKLADAQLLHGDFAQAFAQAQAGDVIYCDPPYSPLTKTANFTSYAGNHFGEAEQARLVMSAQQAQLRGVTTVISNHDTPETRVLYNNATKIKRLAVQRSISRSGHGRIKVKELLAVYKAQ
jgi:DNA adenine methylase